MPDNLDIFRNEYLNANSWAQRKEGVPLYLLDKLNSEEKKIAEGELIKAASLQDTWPITGLGHLQSTFALPVLYKLLDKADRNIKVTIAHAIYQICRDQKMIDTVLTETPRISNEHELIAIFYLLSQFQDQRINALLDSYRHHHEYLVAYNATRVLGLPTEEVVVKFRNQRIAANKAAAQTSISKAGRSWWQKLFGS